MSHEQSESQFKSQLKFVAYFALQMIAQGALIAVGGHIANKVIARRPAAALTASEGGHVSQLRKAV